MELEPQILLEARVLVQEHIVDSITSVLCVFFVDVMLHVNIVRLFFESEAFHLFVCSVEDDSLVDRFTRHHVFHASHDLESIFVQLLGRGDGGHAPTVFLLIFVEESNCNV